MGLLGWVAFRYKSNKENGIGFHWRGEPVWCIWGRALGSSTEHEAAEGRHAGRTEVSMGVRRTKRPLGNSMRLFLWIEVDVNASLGQS